MSIDNSKTPTWVGSSGYNFPTRLISDSLSPTKKLHVSTLVRQQQRDEDVPLLSLYVFQELIACTIGLGR